MCATYPTCCYEATGDVRHIPMRPQGVWAAYPLYERAYLCQLDIPPLVVEQHVDVSHDDVRGRAHCSHPGEAGKLCCAVLCCGGSGLQVHDEGYVVLEVQLVEVNGMMTMQLHLGALPVSNPRGPSISEHAMHYCARSIVMYNRMCMLDYTAHFKYRHF
jgi:hypothetical protein